MTCAHPIPVPGEGMPPTMRYVPCEREAGHDRLACLRCDGFGYRFGARCTGCKGIGWQPRVDPRHQHVEPDGTVREG